MAGSAWLFALRFFPPLSWNWAKMGWSAGAFLPVVAVIELARRDEVVIGLALVGDEISGVAEELGDQLDRLGYLVAFVIGRVAPAFSGRGLAAVVVYPKSGLVHAAHHGRATGRTNRGSDEGVFATNPIPGHPVDIRGLDKGFAIASDMRRCIFDDDPHGVRRGRSLAKQGGEKED